MLIHNPNFKIKKKERLQSVWFNPSLSRQNQEEKNDLKKSLNVAGDIVELNHTFFDSSWMIFLHSFLLILSHLYNTITSFSY